MQRVCVHTHAKCFSALPLPKVTLHMWVPHNNNWKFSPLSWPKGKKTATTQVEGQWQFLTVTRSVMVLTHIFALHHHGMQVTQGRRSAPEKGLQDYRSPKARWWGCPSSFLLELQSTRVSVLQDTITLATVQWSMKAWLHRGCSNASR